MAVKYRLNQEIKYLHKKKATLNTQLYKAHLEFANLWQNSWSYIQAIANEKISKMSNSLYEKLNKKLDVLRNTQQTQRQQNQHQHTPHTFYTRIKNMSDITFNKEEEQVLEMGLNYAFEKPVKHFIEDLIMDTECAIKQLDIKEQNIYRHLASKKLKQLQNTSKSNTLHKRQFYNLKQIRTKLTQNNLIITKADKGKTIVIMHKDSYTQKIEDFLKENHFTQLQYDPTDKYQKQIQQTISKCNTLIEKQQKKYLTQIKPQPPKLKAQIKIHKDNSPIRPVVNSIYAPSYKVAKFLNQWLTKTLQLPNTYVTYNSTNLAHELNNLQITNS